MDLTRRRSGKLEDVHVGNDAEGSSGHALGVPVVHFAAAVVAHGLAESSVVGAQYADSHVLRALDRQRATLARVSSSRALAGTCATATTHTCKL